MHGIRNSKLHKSFRSIDLAVTGRWCSATCIKRLVCTAIVLGREAGCDSSRGKEFTPRAIRRTHRIQTANSHASSTTQHYDSQTLGQKLPSGQPVPKRWITSPPPWLKNIFLIGSLLEHSASRLCCPRSCHGGPSFQNQVCKAVPHSLLNIFVLQFSHEHDKHNLDAPSKQVTVLQPFPK